MRLQIPKIRRNYKEFQKLISESDYGSRNIPLITKLISILTSKLLGLSIKAGKIIKKELSDVIM